MQVKALSSPDGYSGGIPLSHCYGGSVMHVPETSLTDRAQSLWLQYCPYCDSPPRVMTMKSILPAMCRGQDKITYECRNCGYKKVYVLKGGPQLA
jgi:hypothetical protein